MIIILLLSLLLLTLSGLMAYGVKGYGFFTKNEISFVAAALADDEDDKESHNEHESRNNHRTEKNEEDEFWEEMHETIAHFNLFLVSIHILGVLVSSLLHRENLIKAVITGRKQTI